MLETKRIQLRFLFVLLCGIRIDAECDDSTLITGESGVITSPNYPQKYTAREKCSWEFQELTKDSNFTLVLRILDMKLYDEHLFGRKECTASLSIENGEKKEEIPCDSDKQFCYAFRSNSKCFEKIQLRDENSSCRNRVFQSEKLKIIFESDKPKDSEKGFSMTYEYISYGSGNSTTALMESTQTEVETTEATTVMTEHPTQTMKHTTLSSTSDRTETMNQATSGESAIGTTDEFFTALNSSENQNATTTVPLQSGSHVIVIIIGVLLTIVIVIGIVFLIMLQRKRSTPKSAEEFFGVDQERNRHSNEPLDYDVLYPPPGDVSNDYQQIQLCSGREMDGDHLYSGIDLSKSFSTSDIQSGQDMYDRLHESSNNQAIMVKSSKNTPLEGATSKQKSNERISEFTNAENRTDESKEASFNYDRLNGTFSSQALPVESSRFQVIDDAIAGQYGCERVENAIVNEATRGYENESHNPVIDDIVDAKTTQQESFGTLRFHSQRDALAGENEYYKVHDNVYVNVECDIPSTTSNNHVIPYYVNHQVCKSGADEKGIEECNPPFEVDGSAQADSSTSDARLPNEESQAASVTSQDRYMAVIPKNKRQIRE